MSYDCQVKDSGDTEDIQHRVLSVEAQRMFLEALLNPPGPNKKSLEAARRYQRGVSLDGLED